MYVLADWKSICNSEVAGIGDTEKGTVLGCLECCLIWEMARDIWEDRLAKFAAAAGVALVHICWKYLDYAYSAVCLWQTQVSDLVLVLAMTHERAPVVFHVEVEMVLDARPEMSHDEVLVLCRGEVEKCCLDMYTAASGSSGSLKLVLRLDFEKLSWGWTVSTLNSDRCSGYSIAAVE